MAKPAKYPKPLLNFVLLEIPPRKEEITGMVIVKDPKEDRSKAQEGKVLAIGVNKTGLIIIDCGGPIFVLPKIKVGDKVWYSSFTGHQIDNKHIFVKYSDILGVKNGS